MMLLTLSNFNKDLLTGNTLGNNCHFFKACILLNVKALLENCDYTSNENGILCCLHDPSPDTRRKQSQSQERTDNLSIVCPKMRRLYDSSIQKCFLQWNCNSSLQFFQMWPNDLHLAQKIPHAYPCVAHDTQD